MNLNNFGAGGSILTKLLDLDDVLRGSGETRVQLLV